MKLLIVLIGFVVGFLLQSYLFYQHQIEQGNNPHTSFWSWLWSIIKDLVE